MLGSGRGGHGGRVSGGESSPELGCWFGSAIPMLFGTGQVVLPPWDLLPTHESGTYLGKAS